MYRIVFAFFFFSGFTSLVFEVLWERALAKVFGNTSLALSTLLTAFMAGLALGAWLAGKRADAARRPLRVYGLLEGAIGVYALAVPFLFDALPTVYGALFERLFDQPALFAALRFLAAFVILVFPTTLMGASLPFVSQWMSQRSRYFQGKVGLLYAMNTLGACTGTLLAGFVLLPRFGLSSTNWTFGVLNLVLCAVVVAFDHFAPDEVPDTGQVDEEMSEALGRSVVADPLDANRRRLVLAAFCLSGMVTMSYQVLWTRAYLIVLGSSTYSFTLVLTGFLLGLGLGSAVCAPLVERLRRPAAWLAAAQLGLVVFAALTFRVLDDLPRVLMDRLREEIGSPNEIYFFQFFLVGALVFVPIALQGATFPLVVRTFVSRREHAGADVARAYSLNTVGAIAGSFLAGFVLMPLLGLRGGMVLALAVNLVVGLGFAAVHLLGDDVPRRHRIALGIATLVALLAVVFGPSVDRVALTRGLFRVYSARQLYTPEKLDRDTPELVFYSDGISATTTVEKRGALVTLKANGKPEASDGADMSTQILVALLPMMMRSIDHPMGDERVAMIGFGSGVTAGAALQWPLRSLEVVEIEPAMLEASKWFEHVNHRPLEDPRTEIVETDGRNFLEYAPEQFDVIISEPSNPWIAGVASLFTVEHFRRARRKLAPGGVFGQWVQLYEISPENVRVILATFRQAFPHVQAYSSMPKGTDLILLGSDRPLALPPDGFARAWENPTVRAELRRAGVTSAWDPYGLMFMNQPELTEFSDGAPLNTDDNGLLEFAAPHDLIRYDIGEDFFARRYFRTDDYGDPTPHLSAWPRDWTAEQRAELAIAAWKAGKSSLADRLVGEDRSSKVARDYDAVRSVEREDVDELVAATWPSPGTDLHAMVIDTARSEAYMQALMWLERDGEPPRGGFDGEKGLMYAWILAKQKYYRHATEQMEGLRSGEDDIATSAAFLVLDGWIAAKRRRYEQSFDAYLRAADAIEELRAAQPPNTETSADSISSEDGTTAPADPESPGAASH